ncbi:YopX family protein [Companilactobacillus sp.]|uniref:YopX family protein n=1 Tax=Companilactobacillus sp. TaxID=2767905 RepID=UPI0026157357|nr:YopX family protein [Companilactobacillus sp.]
MREIKFRAWDKDMERIVNVLDIDLKDKWVQLDVTYDWDKFDDVELMQYTGKTDENGVDIYDGDVVEVDIQEYVASCYVETIYTCVVKYKDGCFYFAILKSRIVQSDINGCIARSIINLEDVESDDLKVIGNKFQNPELLEAKE